MFDLHHKTMFTKVFPFFKWENRHSVSSKNNYYQSRLNRIDSWEKLYNFIKDSEYISLPKEKEIVFYDLPFGLSQKAIVKQFGKPRHILINNPKIKDHEVYFYKFNFYGVMAKCEIHFIKKSFFLASYFFSRTIDDACKEILDIILLKYMDGASLSFENKFQLVDKNNNRLIFEKDVDYVVTYFSGDSNLNQSIIDKIKEAEFKRLNSRKIRETVLRRAL